MRASAVVPALALSTVAISLPQERAAPPDVGVRLERLTWVEAQPRLDAATVVVLPIGAAAKEHGPHLKLRNDLTMAEYLANRVVRAAPVTLAPPLTYHFYPAFVDYPGSTTLSLETARDTTVDVVRSLAKHGPRRFYALNTGISTRRALEPAAQVLAREGILLTYTNIETAAEPALSRVRQQAGGTHADEIETSMMLYIDPSAVDMSRAVKDYQPWAGAPLTRTREGRGTYSPTGTWGDPTLATREKGQMLVETVVQSLLADIERLRSAPLPARQSAPAAPSSARPAGARADREGDPGQCTPGDERTIRAIGSAYTTHWNNQDAQTLGLLYALDADIVHPDGRIERTRETIVTERIDQFRRREYRGAKHPMQLTMIRCVGPDLAIADGRWELAGLADAAGKPLPRAEGQVTLVVARGGGGWLIAAHRYTVKADGATLPALLKRPGWPKRPQP